MRWRLPIKTFHTHRIWKVKALKQISFKIRSNLLPFNNIFCIKLKMSAHYSYRFKVSFFHLHKRWCFKVNQKTLPYFFKQSSCKKRKQSCKKLKRFKLFSLNDWKKRMICFFCSHSPKFFFEHHKFQANSNDYTESLKESQGTAQEKLKELRKHLFKLYLNTTYHLEIIAFIIFNRRSQWDELWNQITFLFFISLILQFHINLMHFVQELLISGITLDASYKTWSFYIVIL